jgi:hypothetical protein
MREISVWMVYMDVCVFRAHTCTHTNTHKRTFTHSLTFTNAIHMCANTKQANSL